MPILSTELLWYKPAEISDDPTNGGRMSANVITDAVKNNIYPDVSEAERVAGSTKHRKVFIKVANDDDLDMLTPKVFMETFSPGDDIVTFHQGTQTDQQTDLSGNRQFGSGKLDVTVLSGVSVFDVLTEGGAGDPIFVAGDTIRISDKTSVSDAGNNEEFHTIAGGGVSYAGLIATLTITGTLANGYAAADTKIASVIEPSTIAATFDTVVNNSSAGTFDTTDPKLIVDNIGGVEQDWTLTFTSATVFNITGNTLGLVGTGNVGSTTAPNNADFTKPFFTILATAFGGTFVSTETITFSTRPAALPIWHKRIVPAGATAIGNNNFIVAIDGESS